MQAATRLGETIYKGHRSYDLMLNLQLGTRHSVQAYTKQPPVAQLESEHFTHKVSTVLIRMQHTHRPESVWGHGAHHQVTCQSANEGHALVSVCTDTHQGCISGRAFCRSIMQSISCSTRSEQSTFHL